MLLRIYLGLFFLVSLSITVNSAGSLYFPDDCPEDFCPPERPYCCVGGVRCVHTPHDCGDGECLSDSDCPDPHFPCCSPYGYCHEDIEYCSGTITPKTTTHTTISTTKTSSTKSTLLTTTAITMVPTTTNNDIEYCHTDIDCLSFDDCCSMYGQCGSEYCIPTPPGH